MDIFLQTKEWMSVLVNAREMFNSMCAPILLDTHKLTTQYQEWYQRPWHNITGLLDIGECKTMNACHDFKAAAVRTHTKLRSHSRVLLSDKSFQFHSPSVLIDAARRLSRWQV